MAYSSGNAKDKSKMNGRISRLPVAMVSCGAGGEGGYQATGEASRQREAGQGQVPVYVVVVGLR